MSQKRIIDRFDGSHYFLSNFYSEFVEYEGLAYPSSETAFQAQKDLSRRREFLDLSGPDAKRLGRKVKLREDWEEIKDQVMYEIVKNKFTQNAYLGTYLKETRDAELIEGNTWGDTYWGVCNGVGQNKLGKILMQVREELKDIY